jgi:hypothetical protein
MSSREKASKGDLSIAAPEAVVFCAGVFGAGVDVSPGGALLSRGGGVHATSDGPPPA